MEALANVFGVDVLAYTIPSNDYHQILRNRPDVVAACSDRDAAIGWLRVFPGRRLEEYLAEPTENDIEPLCRDAERLAIIRTRLNLIILLVSIGIDASMSRNLMWNWQRYFGRSSCVGRPVSMRHYAQRTGHRYHRG